ncbi:MAG: ATPase [Treponema sp.]|nr:ATPase [Treponema sp.]
MIVPMKKVSLVVLTGERREMAKKLRKLGVMHLEALEGTGTELLTVRDKFDKAEQAIAILSEYKSKKPHKKNLVEADVIAQAEAVIALSARKQVCYEHIAADESELVRFSGWGAVNPGDFDLLSEKGVHLSLYEMPNDAYGDLPETITTIHLNHDKYLRRFLLIGDGSRERPAGLPPEAYEAALPRVATPELEAEIAALKAEISGIDKKLRSAAVLRPQIESVARRLAKDMEFENVCAGMNLESDCGLSWITGYVPAEDTKLVTDAAKTEHWAVAISDPEEDDPVPTKLKNNRLVSLIYPLTDFLETVPGYTEYDISGWFLLYFCLFFGMIFGDAAYGALLSLIAGFGLLSAAVKRKRPAPILTMLLALGLSTLAWGTVTCTWFGIDTALLPEFLRMLSVKPISNVTAALSPEMDSLVKQNLQIFCFSVGLTQLSVAHIKSIIRNRRQKSLKLLADLGSLAMLIGMFNVVLNFVVSSERFPLAAQSLYCIGGGFALSFVFANYDGSIGKAILESCKNIISVLLGVVNIFSDIVSYIRLWAVGLAGGAISSTVNTMAGPLLGHALIFFGILLLLFGHGLNMVLNVLSVLVHGVRLNTLEFSSHLGMAWSGFAYRPFSETAKK